MSQGDDPQERELEELLRAARAERPDPARRAEARRAFLSRADGPARIEAGMPADEEERFAAWLAPNVTAPPSGEARRRARLAFLTPVANGALPRRTRRPFRGLVLALAAAAMLAVTFLLPEPERWRVELSGPARFASGEDPRAVDFAPGDDARLAAALETSGTLEASGGTVRLALGALDLELHPGAALLLPPLPDLDGASAVPFELSRGEAFVRTRAGYPGNPVMIRTAFADVTLSGTTVGVLVDEQGTCVCVAEGTARVTSDRMAGYAQEVGARTTLQVFQDRARGTRMVPFAEGGGAEAAHTEALVGFEKAP